MSVHLDGGYYVVDVKAYPLEIRDGRFTAIYLDRRQVLVDPRADAE